MEILEWTPHLINGAYLSLVAQLRCPHCQTEVEATTEGQLFYGLPVVGGARLGSPSSSINTVVQDLSVQRACEHCGIVSIVPEADRVRVVEKAYNMLTETWFAAEKQRLRDSEGVPA